MWFQHHEYVYGTMYSFQYDLRCTHRLIPFNLQISCARQSLYINQYYMYTMYQKNDVLIAAQRDLRYTKKCSSYLYLLLRGTFFAGRGTLISTSS